jgi:DNA-binding transcriptional MocR family regulator
MIYAISPAQIRRMLADWQHEGPAYSDLGKAIRVAVIDGRLPQGTRIPAERVLAGELEVSRNTVASAYRSLRETGYLASKQGAGSFVTIPPEKNRRNRVVSWAASGAADDIDFTIATPPGPGPILTEATGRATTDLARYSGTPGYDLVGIPELRQAIADHTSRRGLPTTADQIMVTSGAHHAWVLLLQLLSRPHDHILVDSPTYPNTLDSIRALRRQPLSVGLTEEGWSIDLLDRAIRQMRPAMAYLMPTFHNPTGRIMAASTRELVAEAARASGTYLVVDETLSDLSLDGAALPPATASYGSPSWAITVGSLSKTCWAGLRLGWLRASPSIISRLVELRGATDAGNPIVTQLIACHLFRSFADLLDERLAMLTKRRQALIEALEEYLPTCTFSRPPGGLSLWVDIGQRVSSRLALAAPEYGVQLLAGPRFGSDGTLENRIRLPFVHDPATADEGVRRISAALRAVTGPPHRTRPDPARRAVPATAAATAAAAS